MLMNKTPKIAKERRIPNNVLIGELTKRGLSRNTIKDIIEGVDRKYNPTTKVIVAEVLQTEVEEVFGKQ